METASDFELLARFADGRDEQAFSALSGRHRGRVHGVCRRVLHDEHHAEEVVQSTFLVLAQKRLAHGSHRSVGPWLAAVAFRLALHARGERSREQPRGLFAGESEPGRDGDPCDEAARRELRGAVREEIAGLPEDCRAPVVLCYLEGKTNEEAARELNWPTGSMSRRLEKARRILRAKLVRRGLALLGIVLVAGLTLAWLPRYESPDAGIVCTAARLRVQHERRPADDLLSQLVERISADNDRRNVLAFADHARATAERLEARAPLENRDLWQRLAREMNTASQQLRAAANGNDAAETRIAATRLVAACVHCHESVRHY